MARIARVVVPGVPHHVTQRGNRRQRTFFRADDYKEYTRLLSFFCKRHGVEIWAYCLMSNHVHLIATPETEDGFRQAIGEAHRLYTQAINAREGWVGHLWQGRFYSFPMDETHLLAASRYIELNPVKERLAAKPEVYPWSSARAHLSGRDDFLVTTSPLLQRVPHWEEFLGTGISEDDRKLIERHERTGRPLGSPSFVADLEKILTRPLAPKKRGPKRKS